MAQVRRIQSLADYNSRNLTGGYGTPRYADISNLASAIGEMALLQRMNKSTAGQAAKGSSNG